MNVTNNHLAGTTGSTDTAPNAAGDAASRDETVAVFDMGTIESNDKNIITRSLKGASKDAITTGEWHQIRRVAGLQINPETAEFMWIYSQDLEPNGPDPSPGRPDRVAYYRAPGSDEWVSIWDLPKAVRDVLFDKLPDEFFE